MKKIILFSAFSIIIGTIHAQNSGDIDFNFEAEVMVSAPSALSGLKTVTEVPSDSSLIIAGGGGMSNYFGNQNIAKISKTGIVDNNFSSSTNNYILTSLMLPDEDIIIGGQFTEANGVSVGHVVRLNPDGTTEANWNLNGANHFVQEVIQESSSTLLLRGDFTEYQGQPAQGIVRTDLLGNWQSSFSNPLNPISYIYSMAVQPDGKIIISGELEVTVQGVTSYHTMLRLLPNGDIDNTFNCSPDQGPNDIIALSNGDILLAGVFTNVNGIAASKIAKVNSSGTPVGSFVTNSSTGFVMGQIADSPKLTLLPDGKILAVGLFSEYDGVAVQNICRILEDGNIDPSFSASTNFELVDSYLLIDGGILVIGYHTEINGQNTRRYITKLHNETCVPTSSTISESICPGFVYTAPDGNLYSQAGSYLSIIPNAAGCDSTITVNLSVLTVTLNDDIVVNGGTLSAVESNATYQWISCPSFQSIAGETNQSFTPTVSGEYAVWLFDQQGCSTISLCEFVGVADIPEYSQNVIKTYPNPAQEIINIELSEPSSIVLADINGKQLISAEPSNNHQINVADLKSGVYIIRTQNATTHKFIKH